MTDAIFQTLQAVAVMCMGHFQSYDPNDHARTVWSHGFEDCAAIVKAVDDEEGRRAKDEHDVRDEMERKRLENGMAALRGKSFTPDNTPAPKPQSGCNWINPVTGPHPL